MKTKLLKLAMPLMAFMLAIVFAFATEKPAIESESLVISGYIFKDGVCQEATRDCNNMPGPLCEENGFTVHLQPNSNGTFCSVPLTHWAP